MIYFDLGLDVGQSRFLVVNLSRDDLGWSPGAVTENPRANPRRRSEAGAHARLDVRCED
jgi:hypothetical protein